MYAARQDGRVKCKDERAEERFCTARGGVEALFSALSRLTNEIHALSLSLSLTPGYVACTSVNKPAGIFAGYLMGNARVLLSRDIAMN